MDRDTIEGLFALGLIVGWLVYAVIGVYVSTSWLIQPFNKLASELLWLLWPVFVAILIIGWLWKRGPNRAWSMAKKPFEGWILLCKACITRKPIIPHITDRMRKAAQRWVNNNGKLTPEIKKEIVLAFTEGGFPNLPLYHLCNKWGCHCSINTCPIVRNLYTSDLERLFYHEDTSKTQVAQCPSHFTNV